MENISVIIITKNEEKNIKDCLSSVYWADEIILVDAESEDNTRTTAKEFTDKIFVKKWEGFVPQKKYALGLTKNDWVFSLDADERVTPELQKEIEAISSDEYDGYRIRRQNFLFSKEIKSCGWDKDFQLRLFKKSKTELPQRLVHEGFQVKGKTGKLNEVIVHNTFSSLHKYLKKINSYTTLNAEEIYQSKPKVGALTIFSHTLAGFFKYYISLKGFKDGLHGLIISFFNSLSTMLTYVKIWELQRKI